MKITEDRKKKQQDQLVIEKESELYLNSKLVATIIHTPQHEKELALGYLICNKLINTNNINVKYEQQDNKLFVEADAYKEPSIDKKETFKKLDPTIVFQLSAYFQENAFLYKKTAITESASLASNTELVFHSEDITINNALYKVIGQAYINESENLNDFHLLLSAKIDSPLMQILTRLHIPIIITRTAPTKQAVDIATDHKITLIGFARGRRYNLYT